MESISTLHGSAESSSKTAATEQLQPRSFAFLLGLAFLCGLHLNAVAETTQTNLAVIVEHAPTLNGGGVIQGSLQQLSPQNVTLRSGFNMTGDLLEPGSPTVVVHGRPIFAGTVPGNGSSKPANYQVLLEGNCSFNYLRTQTAPVTLPAVSKPPAPTGWRWVIITRPNQSFGDPDTLRNLTLDGNAGVISLPPGTYGNLTVNRGTSLSIGVAGAVEPSTYNLQNLTLNEGATLQVVGPVTLTVANGFAANGVIGSSNNPAWLRLNIASGNLQLNSGSAVFAQVAVPNGQVTIDCRSKLVGTSASADFDLNSDGLVCWSGSAQAVPPIATNQTVILAENSSTNFVLTGFDSDNLPLTYAVLTQPAHGLLTGTPPDLTYQPAANYYGPDAFTFQVSDGETTSSPAAVSITVQPVDESPTVSAGSNQLIILPNTAVKLNGTVTYAPFPNTVDSVMWSEVSGPGPVTFSDASSITTSASFGANGVYVLQLYASDSYLSATSDLTVTVDAPPLVNAGSAQINLFPATAQLSGTVTDDGLPLGGQLTWLWTAVSGPGPVTFNNATLTNATATFSQPGIYTLQLTASDSAAASSNQVVIVEDAAPSITVGTNQVPSGTNQVVLTGAVTDDGILSGAQLTAGWSLVSGPAAVAFNPAVQVTALSGVPVTNDVESIATFSVAGAYVVGVTANDSFASNSATVSLNVSATPPVVSAGPDLYLSGVPATATLNGQAADAVLPAGATLSQQWSVIGGPGTVTFGNSASPVTTATFSTNGIYVLQLTANNGQSQNSSLVEVRVETVCTVEDPEGLAAWWPANGNPIDAVSGEPAILNGVGYTNGEVGLAFNFDGADDAVLAANATNYNVGSSPSGMTIEFWMNPNSFQVGGVLGWANSVRLERESFNWAGAQLRCYLGSGSQYVQTPGAVWNYTNWAWTHVAVTYDKSSGEADMYINGAIVATANVGTNLMSTTNAFCMGQVPGSPNFYSGQLDEISLYRRPLNPEEVYNIYSSGSVGKCPDDTNAPPAVSAGPDLFLRGIPATATLNGQVSDPVLPPGGTLSQQWSVLSGPGAVMFDSPTSAVTTATFSTNGVYVLQLTANNSETAARSLMEVRVETLCSVQDPEGLAAWWPADGTAEDIFNGNYGILGGGASYTNGEVGLAFNFNGVDNFVDVPAATNYNVGASPSGMTIEFWMHPNSFQNGSVLGWANSVRVERESYSWGGAQLRCYFGTGGQYVQTPGSVWNNNNWAWTHVAATYDAASGEADMYINGAIAASANVGTNLMSTTNDFYMGQVPGSPNFYSGQLDEISLYRRPLNPQEVYNIYSSGSIGKCPDANTVAVSAGPNFALPSATNSVLLTGSVTENGQPAGNNTQVQWSEYYGPGTIYFSSPTSTVTSVSFSADGIYLLQLSANNGDEESSGLVEVRVGVPCNDQDLPGLSAWWPADGTAQDVIGGNVAILGGGASYTNGEVATAFNFDGADDFVWAPAATNYNVGASPSGMTIEFWMKPNSFQNGSVLGWANSVRVERESYNWGGAQLRCYLGAGGQYVQTSGSVWNNNNWTWTHVAVTYDATNGQADIYINGILQATANVGGLMSTTNDFYMGQVPGSPNFYSGQLDEISLYNQPLSAEDIAAIYASGPAGKCPGNLNLIVNQSAATSN